MPRHPGLRTGKVLAANLNKVFPVWTEMLEEEGSNPSRARDASSCRCSSCCTRPSGRWGLSLGATRCPRLQDPPGLIRHPDCVSSQPDRLPLPGGDPTNRWVKKLENHVVSTGDDLKVVAGRVSGCVLTRVQCKAPSSKLYKDQGQRSRGRAGVDGAVPSQVACKPRKCGTEKGWEIPPCLDALLRLRGS